MARLPRPGGDNGNWGTVLNDYLSQVHTAEGLLKDDVIGTAHLKDNSVTANIIAPGAVTKATVGLTNVDNTSDATKPVSTAQQTALDQKADTAALATKLNTADLDAQTAEKITTDGTATQNALSSIISEGFSSRVGVGERTVQYPAVRPTKTYGPTNYTNNWDGTSAVIDDAFTTTAPSNTNAFGARLQLSAAENWSSDSLLLELKCDNWAAITDGYLIAWSPGADATFQIRPALSNVLANNEWHQIPVALSGFVGTVNWTQVTNVFFQWFSANGVTPKLSMRWTQRVRRPVNAVVSITFDDGFASTDTVALPILRKYGMRGGVPVMPGYVGSAGYLNEAQIANLASAGWDINGHGIVNLTTLSQSAMAADVKATRLWLSERNYKGGDIYVYPQGGHNASIVAAVSAWFRHARGTLNLVQTAYATDAFNSCAYQLGPSITLNAAKARVTAAAANGEWLNLTFHALRTPTITAEDWTPADFEALIEHVAASGVQVATMSEVLDSVRAYNPGS